MVTRIIEGGGTGTGDGIGGDEDVSSEGHFGALTPFVCPPFLSERDLPC